MILFALFISLFLILQPKIHFQTCLCAIPKWKCDCRLSINLWQPSLSFGSTANLERALDVISFPFKARRYQFSGHVFLFHYTLFFLPFFFCYFFSIITLCSPCFTLFSDHSISGHKHGHNSLKGLRSLTRLWKRGSVKLAPIPLNL